MYIKVAHNNVFAVLHRMGVVCMVKGLLIGGFGLDGFNELVEGEVTTDFLRESNKALTGRVGYFEPLVDTSTGRAKSGFIFGRYVIMYNDTGAMGSELTLKVKLKRNLTKTEVNITGDCVIMKWGSDGIVSLTESDYDSLGRMLQEKFTDDHPTGMYYQLGLTV